MLRFWSYDLAREQCPRLDHLFALADTIREGGYDGLGLYLEHRFAYPSAPWAAGEGALTPAMVRRVRSEYPSVRVIPMLNLLGHMEGFLRCREGEHFSEEPGRGMQACPSHPEFPAFAMGLLNDALEAFDDEIVHLGGDETATLGKCPLCRTRTPADLYASHFAPLCQRVLAAGRRPALWGDMILAHREIAERLPKETLIFDWQYFGGIEESSSLLMAMGFDVVACPTLHTYNAAWLHLPQSAENVERVASEAHRLGLAGLCLTTWEMGLLGAYDTLFPAIRWAGDVLQSGSAQVGLVEGSSQWSRLLGVELPALGEPFAHSNHRSKSKVRLLLQGDPFLAWRHHRSALTGPAGANALDIAEQALLAAQDEAQQGVAILVRGIVEFVRLAEEAAREYDAGRPEAAIAKLASTRMIFDQLSQVARRTVERIGGSQADVERCRVAREQVERVMVRIRRYGDASLGYTPSFAQITEPRFMPHDQGAWWQVNDWA